MPPKKPKRNKIETPLDEVDTTGLTRQKLEEFCINVNEALKKERQQSDFLRIERNKLINMMNVSRQQLIGLNNARRMHMFEIQLAEDEHRLVMKEHRHKLINLKCEKNVECLETKLKTAARIDEERLSHNITMNELRVDIDNLKGLAKKYELNLREIKTRLEIEQAEKKHKLRQKEQQDQIIVESKWEKVVNNNILELNNKFSNQLYALGKLKEKETTSLLKNQLKFTTALRHYYDKIINNNMTIIMTTKTNIQGLKNSSALLEKTFLRFKRENKELQKSLLESTEMEQDLRKKLFYSEKDQYELMRTKKRLDESADEGNKMRWEVEALNILLEKQNKIREEKLNNEKQVVISLKTQLEEMLIVLEHIASHLQYRNNELGTQLYNLRPMLENKGKSLDLMSPIEDTSKDELTYELTSVAAQRDRVFEVYQQILRKYHLCSDNTGFTPLATDDLLKGAVYLRVLVEEDIK